MSDLSFAQASQYQLPYTPAQALIQFRRQAQDFQLQEFLGFAPEGQGEHLWLWVQKCEQNTPWVAEQIAKVAGVRARDLGYAGLKDRHSLSCQWFSVWCPQHQPEEALAHFAWPPGIQILKMVRHARKLKRGVHLGNHFQLELAFVGLDAQARTQIHTNVQRLQTEGMANYFGYQRFGHQGHNLLQAEAWRLQQRRAPKRQQKGFYLSGMRAWLFNAYLDQQIRAGTWLQAQAEQTYQVGQGYSQFRAQSQDITDIQARIAQGQLHPCAPLWGALPKSPLAAQEAAFLQQYEPWCTWLAQQGLHLEQRATRVYPQNLQWQWLDEQSARLTVSLPRGSFVTVLLQHLAAIEDQHLHPQANVPAE